MKSLHASNSVIIIALVATLAVLFAGKPAEKQAENDNSPKAQVVEKEQQEANNSPSKDQQNSANSDSSPEDSVPSSKQEPVKTKTSESKSPSNSKTQEPTHQTIKPVEKQADLEDISDSGGAGTVATSWDRVKFEIEVQATLPAIPPHTYYQVWLENESGEKIKLGELKQQGPLYNLGSVKGKDLSSYTTAKISYETKDDDQIETIILQGQLQ